MIRAAAEPIAIIGIGLRFPGGARGPDAFWRMLREGRSGISEPPAHRIELGFNIDEIYDPRPGTPGKISSKLAGFLDHPELFDPFVFGLSPRDVVAMEPQQRYALEVVFDALDDAGIPHDSLMGERVAVIFGRMNEDYSREHIAVLGEDRFRRNMDVWHAAGITGSVLSGRISFWLGTRGPSFFIDTACSTSLLSVHLACQSLWSGETHTAIAGGVNVFITPEGMIALSRVGMMAPDGKIKAFDDRANGFVRAEGAGAVVLRPLAAALANGDPIHAVIRGTGFSADGRDGGHMMAPGRFGQAQAIRDAYERAGIPPSEVHFVEAHGTGTVVGDPVEIAALADVMGPGRPKERPLLISSVKANIGHAEPASGVAGLIKATLAVKHREIPPQINFETPSTKIPWDQVPVRVQAERTPWPYPERALAGVNSFGISGTNAHVVLEEAPALPAPAPDDGRARLVTLTAHTDRALVDLVDAVRADAALGQTGSDPIWPTLRDIAYTQARRRTLRGQRLAVVARSRAELASELAGFLSGAPSPTTTSGAASGKPPAVVFAFSGHGTHWAGMGKTLLARELVFAAAIDAWDREQCAHVQWRLRDLLERAVGGDELDRIDVLQPALTGIAIALARQWESWGVKPAAVLGHSSGEIAAAHIAGAISLADAARIACARGAVVRELAPPGAMAIVALPESKVAPEIERFAGRAAIAGTNSPTMTVLSGDIDAIESAVAAFSAQGVFARRVRVEFASHGPHMDALAPELARRAAHVRPTAARVPFYSTVSPGVVAGESLTPTYWGDNLRRPVRFAEAAARAVADGFTTFVEIGPNPVLKLALEEVARAAKARALVATSLRRDGDDPAEMLASLGALFCAGVSVDLAALHPEGRVVAAPLYPFQREEYWFGAKRGVEGRRSAHPFAGLIGANASELEAANGRERFWQIDLFREALGSEVKRDGELVVPSAELIATALGIGMRLWPGESAEIAGLELREPLALPKSGARTLQIAAECGAHAASLRFASRTAGSGAAFEPVASCRVLRAGPPAQPTLDLAALRSRCSEPEARNEFYAALEASGLAVPKERRALRDAGFGAGEALAKLAHAAPPASHEPVPALLLDAALQLLVRLAERTADDALSRFELAGVEGVTLGASSVTSELFAYARLAARQDSARDDLLGEVALLGACGETIASLTGARLARRVKPVAPGAGPFLYELAWRPLDAGATAADEPQRAMREGVLCAPRLVPLSLPVGAPPRAAAGEREFAAEAAEPTRLTGALLRELLPRAPGAGEVALEVKAAGLSFLDVLRSFGLEANGEPGLGCEVAGVVRDVGRGVTTLRPGDEVLGFARCALASRVITDAALLLRKPARLSFEQAAALPLARAVAQHALRELARVRAGERILVHSAGGAIGQAATALAVQLGAEVVATAGSEQKRASLRARGAAQVADSRSPRVADDLIASSDGRLFDVALDLAGDGVPLAVLASGGRYVAMQRTGRADGIERAPSPRNLSRHALDPLELLQSRPGQLVAALRDSLAEASSAQLASLPLSIFPISQLGRAIRFMAQARHDGKVVVSLAQRGEAKIAPLGASERIAGGAVLAFGELERFPAVAHWLAAQRPRELYCVSEGESLEAASAKLSAPLRAVVFAPSSASAREAILRAREIVSLASEQGAALTWLLADATAVLEPHANAEAARTASALADLARARRATGEPVTALALGALAPTPGAAAQLTRIAQSGVSACILHATAPGAWDPASAPLLRELGAANAPPTSRLASATPEERRAKLRELVGAALAIVLRLSAPERARIDWHRPLAELGLDSLMGVELHARIEEAAGIEIPPALLFAEPNLEAVVERISASLAASA